MARKTYYKYIFSNEELKWMTPEEANEYCFMNSLKIKHNGHKVSVETFRRTKDGFQSGYNPGLGEYVRGREHYSQLLKEKGLVEVGNERMSPQNNTIPIKYHDDSFFAEAAELGANFSGGEMQQMIDTEKQTAIEAAKTEIQPLPA